MAQKDQYSVKTDETREGPDTVVAAGTLDFIREEGGNYTGVGYQEASGAPVESSSPLGYEINTYTIIFLNVGQMVGTGVFSTRMFSFPFALLLYRFGFLSPMVKYFIHYKVD